MFRSVTETKTGTHNGLFVFPVHQTNVDFNIKELAFQTLNSMISLRTHQVACT